MSEVQDCGLTYLMFIHRPFKGNGLSKLLMLYCGGGQICAYIGVFALAIGIKSLEFFFHISECS